MKRCLLLTGLSSLLLLQGCATMSESECQTADWRMVGMEDGSKGRLESYIGNHRSACSNYGIQPDLDRYRSGHAEGVRLFCTESKGFEYGKQGYEYNGVCPPLAEQKFLRGYDHGHELYTLQAEVNRLESLIHSGERKINRLEDESRNLEDQLTSGNISSDEKKRLVREIRDNDREIGKTESDIRQYNREQAVAERELRRVQGRY
ncbi:MAG: DUF2799 domain-containing protein [bacterium]